MLNRINKDVSYLRARFRAYFDTEVDNYVFYHLEPLKTSLMLILKNCVLLHASACYYCGYSQEKESNYAPVISFPWVFYDVLCNGNIFIRRITDE